jgi:tRNA-splicing endonuclease subunit Sen34
MPEEAKLLVEKGVSFIVDDRQWHLQKLSRLGKPEKMHYLRLLEDQGREAAAAAGKRASEKTERARKKPNGEKAALCKTEKSQSAVAGDSVCSLFTPPPPPSSNAATSPIIYAVTPTTTEPYLAPPDATSALVSRLVPNVPRTYPLFAHIHAQGYFISPGLRFGCQYMVYPGDPLRFHSHFLAVGYDWDEEIDLLDLVGGGRLCTGVKKGYVIGGQVDDGEGTRGEVRTFCIEWGGM